MNEQPAETNDTRRPMIYASHHLDAGSVVALMEELIAWWPQRPRGVIGVNGGTSHLNWVRDTYREVEVVERPKPALTPEQMLLAAISGQPCSGADNCPAPVHVHGCYSDIDGASCSDPEDHVTPSQQVTS